MPQYKVTVTEIEDLQLRTLTATEIPADKHSLHQREIFNQVLSELNLPKLIRALNPETRKRRVASGKRDGS